MEDRLTRRIEAVQGDPPDWLIAARDNQRKKCAQRRRRRERQSAASRWGITVRVVTERDIAPADVGELLAAEVGRVKWEARRRVDELSPEQVRARIDRERQAAHAAGVYRATQLVRRALGFANG